MNPDQITPLTAQQLFDNALLGVRKDGYRGSFQVTVSDDPNSGILIVKCRYRFEGRACGIGHSIPDALYDPRMEMKSASALTYDPLAGHDGDDDILSPVSGNSAALAVKIKNLFGDASEEFLQALQYAHDCACQDDGAFNASKFEREMKRVAGAYHLTYTPA